jgi:hypothetical protein
MQGVPMVASSPVRHEQPANHHLAPIEVLHQYHVEMASTAAPPWKALSNFALQTELDQPPFQQLVSSFGESSGDEDDDTVVCLDEPSRIRHNRVIVGVTSLHKPRALTTSLNESSSRHHDTSHCTNGQPLLHMLHQSCAMI